MFKDKKFWMAIVGFVILVVGAITGIDIKGYICGAQPAAQSLLAPTSEVREGSNLPSLPILPNLPNSPPGGGGS